MLLRTIAIAVVAAPLVAAAQSEVSHATITGSPVVRTDRLHVCAERNDKLWDRSGLLDRDKQDVDREGREIARMKARLDSTDTAAVADYNARVAAHNRQVDELNGAVALLNADSSQLTAYCNRLSVGSR